MYGYIKLPYTKVEKPIRDQEKEGFSFGSLTAAALTGNFTGDDGVFNQISKGVGALDELNSKFSVVAMTQLVTDGKISSTDALNYFTEGFANQLGFTAVTMGFQSLGAMKEALGSGNINAGQFLSSFGAAINGLSDQEMAKNINKEETIFLDLVLSESFTKTSETSERRVEGGQTLSEFIHNMPILCDLTCQFIEGVNYAQDEFEWQLDYLRDRKVAVGVQLGDDLYKSYVLTNYSRAKGRPSNGFEYNLSFKEFTLGSIEMRPINIEELNNKYAQKTANIVKNGTNGDAEDKTSNKKELGGIKEIQKEVFGSLGL